MMSSAICDMTPQKRDTRHMHTVPHLLSRYSSLSLYTFSMSIITPPITCLNGEISTDGSRGGVSWVGGAKHLAAGYNSVLALPDHGNHGS